MLFEGLRQVFSMLLLDVDSDFSHDFDCQRISIRASHRRAYRSEFVARECLQKTFRHLAARRVACREDENLGFANHYALRKSRSLWMSPQT